MGSMNWLGFSLSPQEQLSPSEATDQDHPHHHHHSHDQATVVSHRLAFNSDEISGTDVSGGDCFDLTSDVSTAHPASLNHLPSSFGILEAFNRNINHSQDWNMKGLGMNSDDSNYKSSTSELSMLMGSSCSSHNLEDHHHQNHQQQQPKLENFLGRHSFADPDHHHHNSTTAAYNNSTSSHDYMFSNCSLQLPSETSATTNNLNNNGGGSSIGLSMIKTWLRNQPAAAAAAAAPPHDQQPQMEINKNNDGGGSVNVNNAKTSAQSTLSLSMSTGSHATATTAATTTAPGDQTCSSDNKQSRSSTTTTTNGTDISQTGAIEAAAVPRKSIDTFGQRTSIYRGVTRHRWTGRYEAHLWDNSCRREGQTRKGRQVYLGGYDKEEKAARAYDLAALKYWGTTTTTNFPISNYETEIHDMKDMTRQEYVASLRRKSSGFSRGASIYRGVTRHHQHGRWQARIGRVAGNKDLYLGTFSTQEEAAEAYDIAAIKFRGLNAVTNFDMSRYDVKSILESSTLPIGAAKRLKDVEQQTTTHHPHHDQMMMSSTTSSVDHDINMMSSTAANSHHHQLMSSSDAAAAAAAGMYHAAGWPTLAFNQLAHHHHHQQPPFSMHYSSAAAAAAYGQHGGQSRVWCKQEQDTTNSNQSSIIHDHHSQDDPDLRHHQLQLGSTHNFFQPTAMHNLNLMGLMDHSGTSSMEYSAGSTTGGSGYGGGGGGGGYIIPMAMGGTVIANNDHHCISSSTQNQDSAGNGTSFGDGDDQNVYGSSTDNTYAAAARNLYYLHPQQSSSSVVKASAYDHNNWVPTAVPTHLGRSSSNTSMQAQGPPTTFTVWNDT